MMAISFGISLVVEDGGVQDQLQKGHTRDIIKVEELENGTGNSPES